MRAKQWSLSMSNILPVAQGTDTSGEVGSNPTIRGNFDESRARLFPGRFLMLAGCLMRTGGIPQGRKPKTVSRCLRYE
jgi:hypothetical protein